MGLTRENFISNPLAELSLDNRLCLSEMNNYLDCTYFFLFELGVSLFCQHRPFNLYLALLGKQLPLPPPPLIYNIMIQLITKVCYFNCHWTSWQSNLNKFKEVNMLRQSMQCRKEMKYLSCVYTRAYVYTRMALTWPYIIQLVVHLALKLNTKMCLYNCSRKEKTRQV